ncbi:hypothetical protein GJW-30_1_00203 [Variibacter gotjawalensis]|uniref:DNA repair protein MmcB-related protein n=1 Tax=Variibacter gotjawalensis TaxID=1333996 RepID=A0A0S3PP48_9BRAD|nr:MmcB family DNA repair protein [Variibacter gotjawalensis]NIK47989.1 hypothetical protein [Variibacter gotjawalensis]RZS49866.1 hypothetical protein EV661_2312 [Variibacter gotjawalensis]BAT57695.1 hypothetical protein GJW-30_1_00203 [Variibacter gotjawalensis]
MLIESLTTTTTIIRDGRQSPTALLVARGTCRLLRQLGFAAVPEMPLASGRRADLAALGRDGEFWIVEIKSSIEDFRVDQKWPEYRWHCDRLWFATAPHVPIEIFPEDAGLIVADSYGAEIIRDAPEHKLPAATRRSMLLRYARLAASRLHGLSDPSVIGDLEL